MATVVLTCRQAARQWAACFIHWYNHQHTAYAARILPPSWRIRISFRPARCDTSAFCPINIWIFNPFDELPGDTDMRHRYWSLADTLAAQGHAVTWWSSNFSHRLKSYRTATTATPAAVTPECLTPECPAVRRWSLRLIPTPPYAGNVSLARLRNHRAYARRLLQEARKAVASAALPPPDRIVASLPPLGSPLTALQLRAEFGCPVVVDIMDAWPETFYRVLPLPERLRALAGPVLFAPLHAAARSAITGADRVSAVSQIFIDLARKIREPRDASDAAAGTRGDADFHLCHHGIDLPAAPPRPPEGGGVLRVAYIGSLGRSYDLGTAIRAVQALAAAGHAISLEIAGAGTRDTALRALAARAAPVSAAAIRFHGLLNREGLSALLGRCHAGLIPMRQDSYVGLPYKLADYCAAGLAVISSLDGECRSLLDTKKAGSFYEPGSVESLGTVLKTYLEDPHRPISYGRNARALAMAAFDRASTYPALARFIVR